MTQSFVEAIHKRESLLVWEVIAGSRPLPQRPRVEIKVKLETLPEIEKEMVKIPGFGNE